jgi:CRP-like cAMP-binding protein
MKTKSLKSGEMLFLKGDEADRLYFLADGQIEFVEIGSKVDHGTVFGEIACRRRLNSEPPCRSNIEPGLGAVPERVGCG